MGSVLAVNSTVDTEPARTATLTTRMTLRIRDGAARRVGYPSGWNVRWVESLTKSPARLVRRETAAARPTAANRGSIWNIWSDIRSDIRSESSGHSTSDIRTPHR